MTNSHVHRHTEAFYVLEGQLTFQVGAERETVTLGAGGFVAVPPGVAHSYGTAGGEPARWLSSEHVIVPTSALPGHRTLEYDRVRSGIRTSRS